MSSWTAFYTKFISEVTKVGIRAGYVVLAIVVFILIQRISSTVISKSRERLQAHPSVSGISVSFWLSFIYYAIVIAAFLGALRIAGISYTSILAGVSITGLIVGLATQNILANLFAGMMVLAQKPFDIGDWVSIDNYSGSVKAINVLTTRVETLERTEVTIPNKLLMDGPIVNFTKNPTRLWNFSFYVDQPEKQTVIKDQVRELLRNDQRIVEEPTLFTELMPDGVRINVRVAVQTQDFIPFNFGMQEKILELLLKMGCRPFAVTEVSCQNGGATK
jgi:small conductance mechanosensitive channel